MTFNSSGVNKVKNDTVKFLYSYGGKILPRRTDGKPCYVGGHTRVLSIHRSVGFSELMVRFGELCGLSVTLKCKLPNEDLDVLVSITCDEDLVSFIDEYTRYSSTNNKDLKIRAILFHVKSVKNTSIPISILPSGVTYPRFTKTVRRRGNHSPVAVGLLRHTFVSSLF